MATNIQGLKKKEQEKLALAEKLEEQFGEKRPPPSGKPFYDDFDSYVRDYPEGERYRAWLTNRGRRPVALLLMSDYGRMGAPHGGLPGEYLALTVSKFNGEIFVCLHDCDDGLARRILPEANQAEADELVANMKQLAPFDMWDAAKVFDLSWN